MSQFPTSNLGGEDLFPTKPPPVYERVGAFDYPEILFYNLIDRELGSGFVPITGRTAQENSTLASRIRQELDGNPFKDLAVALLTDPLFMASVGFEFAFKLPGLSRQMRRGAGEFFRVSDAYNPILRKGGNMYLGFMGKLNPKTGNNILEDETTIRVLDMLNKNRLDFLKKHGDDVASEMFKVKRLSNKAQGQEDSALIYAWLSGRHVDHTSKIARLNKAGERMVVEFDEAPARAILDASRLEGEMKKRGVYDLAVAMRSKYDELLLDVFGVDKASGVVDEKKLERIYRGIASGSLASNRNVNTSNVGVAMIGKLLGNETMDNVRAGAMSMDNFKELIRESFVAQPFYAPRNTARYYSRGMNGIREVSLDEVRRLREGGRDVPRQFKAGANAVGREVHESLWDDVELNLFDRLGLVRNDRREEFGLLRDQGAAVKRKMQSGLVDADVVRLHKMDAFEAMSSYLDDTSRLRTMFVDEVDGSVRAAMKRQKSVLDKLKEVNPVRYEQLMKTSSSSGAGSVLDTFDDLPEPVGGWTNFDVVHRAFHLFDKGNDAYSQYARDALTEVYLPLAMGSQRLQQGLMTSMVNQMKAWTKSVFDDTNLGGPMNKAGLGSFVSHMRNFADEPLTGKSADYAVTKWFYASTLGANVPSALVNLTQPWATTVRVTGLKNLLKGYGEAFKDAAAYASERSKVPSLGVGRAGQRAISPATQRAFRMADDADIAPNIDQMVEQLDAPSRILRDESGLSRFNEFLLKGFSFAEWFNRSVSAHAARFKAIEDGLDGTLDAAGQLRNADTKGFVRRLVQESQFTPDLMNTPMLFLNPSSPFSQPLLRQFLTFPLRTAISPWEYRKYGGSNSMLNFAVDANRMILYSSLLNEAGKQAGLDLFDTTAVGTVTELMTGLGTEGLNRVLPPVIDIPLKFTSGIMSGERDAIARSLPLFAPGGLALSRVAGILPPAKFDNFYATTHAGWDEMTPDGQVPLYDSTGRLITYESKMRLLLKGLGFSRFGLYNSEGEIIKQLQKDREKMTSYRQEYMRAIAANDLRRASDLEKAFYDKFGFRLSVDKQNLKTFLDNRTVPRVERTLNSMPEELRARMTEWVAQGMGPQLGIDAQTFSQFDTATQRMAARTSGQPSNEELMKRLEQLQRENRFEQPVNQTRVFGPLGGF
jgi:hypothetical protein